MKYQVVYIHGGTTFSKQEDYLDFLKNRKIIINGEKKWKDNYLNNELGNDFQIIRPRMPLSENAKYNEWKINFERYIPYLDNHIILIGSSLGGIFLVKYLSENKFPKKILSVYLVGTPFDNTLIQEELVGGFDLGDDLSLIEENCPKITFFFSRDDNIIPLSHMDKYKEKIKNANFIILDNMNNHFQTSKFPEIVQNIKNDIELINE